MDPKTECMKIAATLAASVVSNLPDTLTLDPDVKSQDVKAENLFAWEVFRIFYAGVKGAMEDDKNWPRPNVSTAAVPNLDSTKIASLLAGPAGEPIMDVITKALNVAKTAIPNGPIPSPAQAVGPTPAAG